MDLMKLEEISDCWKECLRQNEEEQMLFSPSGYHQTHVGD